MPWISPNGWQSLFCLEANTQNKKWFPRYGNQSNVISNQHILTQRQRGEECPIDWYCLLGWSRWSPEEKTSVAGGPPHSSPLSAFFPLYMSQYLWDLRQGGGELKKAACVYVYCRGAAGSLSHAGSVEGWGGGAEETEPSPARLLEC